MILAAALDAFDGTLARTTGKATKFGAVFDSVFDRLFEGAVLGGVLYFYMDRGDSLEAMLVFAAMVGSFGVSYVRARAEGEGISLYDGIFTRVVRLVALTVGLVLGGLVSVDVLDVVVAVLAAGAILTTFHRLYAVWDGLRAQAPEVALMSTPSADGDTPARAPLEGDEEMAFLHDNWESLAKQYPGMWIAIKGTRVVANSLNEMDADLAARAEGVDVPLVVRMPHEDDPPFIGAMWVE
jgi:phosphatidylglycerophosphate synthase